MLSVLKHALEQALLYRLSGDYNLLHVDPDFASMVSLREYGHAVAVVYAARRFGYIWYRGWR